MLTTEQKLYGGYKINVIAGKWRVTPLRAAQILNSREFRDFWHWVHADEFLCDYLYNLRSTIFFEETAVDEIHEKTPDTPCTGPLLVEREVQNG
uniref:Uncharacterized protein n=1 Tax=viral metagenome TaxID=1070528 RepID=A0A6M3LT24_9ZZZZ